MDTIQCVDIGSFVGEAIGQLPDRQLADAVERGFNKARGSVEKVEECFERLTSRSWPRPAVERFFHG